MKTPEQAAQERIAKANEELVRLMRELNKSFVELNRTASTFLNRFGQVYRDIEVTEPVEKESE